MDCGGGGDDWDLAAVVRSCCSRAKPPAAAAASSSIFEVLANRHEARNEMFPSFSPDLSAAVTSRSCEGLEELYRPFFFKPPQPQQRPRQAEVCSSLSSSSAAASHSASVGPTSVPAPKKPQRPASLAPRSKRRKKQLKKVVCKIPADGVSSDMWAWRKYGQKPIKGSPYPRGYYRCSSFRGCPARKQVERNRTDPGQLIITYTSDHNHPMPAGHKFPSDSAPADAGRVESNRDPDQITSSPATSASVDGDEEEAMLMVEDMEMIGEDELVFVGDADASAEAEATGGDPTVEDDGGFDDRPFASIWLDSSNNSSATAAAC